MCLQFATGLAILHFTTTRVPLWDFSCYPTLCCTRNRFLGTASVKKQPASRHPVSRSHALCDSRCRYKPVAQQRGFSAANLSASRDAWARWPRPGAAVRIQERAAWAPKRRLPCINTRGSSGSGPSPVHRIGRVPRVLPARPDPCASRASRWNQR